MRQLLCVGLAMLALGCGAKTGLLIDRFDAGHAGRPDTSPACPWRWDDTIEATIAITTDDSYALYVEGALIDDTQRLWSSPQHYTVALYRHPMRRNAIAIEGTNRLNIDGLDRGIVIELDYTTGGLQREIVSDARFRLASAVPMGWTDTDFDDGAWVAATVEAPHGAMPWGAVLGTSDASWIWSYVASMPAGAKPTLETIHVRRDFYLDRDGVAVDAPTRCP